MRRDEQVLVEQVHAVHTAAAVRIGVNHHHIVATALDVKVASLSNGFEHIHAAVSCLEHAGAPDLTQHIDMEVLETHFHIGFLGEITRINERCDVVLHSALCHAANVQLTQHREVDVAVVVNQIVVD